MSSETKLHSAHTARGRSPKGEMSDWDASFQLCVFDTSRGQSDGHELDKILFFYPTDCPLAAQLSLIGLGEGLITFTRIFSPDAPCDIIDTQRRKHVFLQPEQGLWMIMVIEKQENGEPGRTCALQAVLREAHGLFTLFYGCIRALLSKDQSGDIARSCLHAFLPDYLADFMTGKKMLILPPHDGLQERGTIQMMALNHSTALEVQAVISLLQSWFGSGRICHTLMLFQDKLLSTTLPPDDAAYVYTYARMRLAPATISSTSSGSRLRRGLSRANSASHFRTNPSEIAAGGRNLLQEDSSVCGLEGFTPRPLQRDKWWRDHDGYLVTDAWGVDAQGKNANPPTVRLQQASKDPMQLIAYQHKQLTVVMLISVTHLAADADGSYVLQNQVMDKALDKLTILEERIAREWGGRNANHVPGYRYLLVDNDSRVSRASPGSKIATLTKDSLLSLNKVRAETDLAKARSEGKGTMQPYDLETCVRTRSNAWVVVRILGSYELYIVLERASETLLLTAEAAEKFSRRHCDGIFAFD